MEELEKAKRIIRQLLRYLDMGDVQAVNAVYLTPAASLRQSADEIEAKEKFLKEAEKFANS